MYRVVLVLVGLGGALIYWGGQEALTSVSSKSEPQTISVRDLGQKGPGDNYYVRITDFRFGESFVYEEASSGGQWTKVYFPILPIDDAGRNVKVVVKTTEVTSQFQVDSFGASGVLEGLVANNLESLGSDEQSILNQDYSIDYSSVWVISHNQRPPGFIWPAVKIGGGGVMLVGGLLLGIGLMMRK